MLEPGTVAAEAGADVVGADAINRVPTVFFGELADRVERVPALRLFVRVAIVLSDSKNKDKHVVALHMIGHVGKSGKMKTICLTAFLKNLVTNNTSNT